MKFWKNWSPSTWFAAAVIGTTTFGAGYYFGAPITDWIGSL